MRLLRRLITFTLAFVLIILSVMNRHDISLFWGPDRPAITIPLYLVFFAGIFFGLLAAAFATSWLRLKAFTRARAAERRAAGLEDERATLNQELTTLQGNERKKTHMGQSKTDLVSPDDNH